MTAVSETSLGDYYRTTFELKEYRDGGVWDLREIDDLFPYELDLYILMLKARVQERRDAANLNQNGPMISE